MHTETEAKTKWCPEVRSVAFNEITKTHALVAANAVSLTDGKRTNYVARCIASRCMHWRWAQKPNPDWKPAGAMAVYPAPDHRFDPQPYIEDRTKGYCGLSGRP